MSSIFDGIGDDGVENLDENLRKWFKEKWVRFGPDGKIRGACARGDDSEGKPKCLPQKKAHSLGKKGRKYAASKKRREDPNPERRGKAKNVATKKKTNESIPFNECPECRGPIVHESMINEKQDACYHKVKARYKVWPSAYASGALVQCRKKGAKNWGTGGKKKNESSVIKGIVDESTNFVTENILTEGKVLLEGRVVRKLWESAGQKIVEAQLTPQQIQQIFQSAEQGMTAGGANRTFAGKGKDAAVAVNRAWEDLKTKIQNTGPIQNMDAMYDKAAEAMKKSTGGDQGAMQYVQKYRDFAKKHPIAQSFLYAALIAAAGLSGAGLGGAAALGLLKMTDRLLQGDKFSSALYKGGVTGALAYGAARIGDLLRQPAAPNQPVQVKIPNGQDIVVKPGDTLSQIAEKNNVSVKDLMDANKDILNPDAISAGQNIHVPNATGNPTYQGGIGTAADTAAKVQSGEYSRGFRQAAKAGLQNQDGFDADAIYRDLSGADVVDQPSSLPAGDPSFKDFSSMVEPEQAASSAKSAAKQASGAASDFTQNELLNSVAKEIRGKVVDIDPNGAWAKLANGQIVDPDFPMDVSANNDAMAAYKLLNKTNESVQLSKYQVFSIMEAAIMYQTALNEGLMDKFKGAVSKVGQYAATKGHNITTKITADKLLQAWKKAGSPTDSEKVKAVLKSAGVTDQVIATIMPVQASIAGVQPKATTGAVTSTVKATTQPTVAAKPQAPAAPAAQPTSAISQGIAKSPQANVNPELYKRLAARKAGKPIYTYEAAGDTLLDPEVALPQARKITKLIKYDDTVGEIITQIEMLAERTEGIDSRTIQYAIDGVLSAKNALESAVYDLEEAFEDAARDAEFKRDEELGEDTDMRYAAEKTPAINPYGGQKDRQFRGAISETPTDNPTGASGEGGWRTYKPKVAGTVKEEQLDEGLMQKIGAAAMAAALALGANAAKAEPVYVYKAPTGDFKAVLSPSDIPANAVRRLVVDTENDDVSILGKDGSETPIKLDPSTVNSIKQRVGLGQARPAQAAVAPQQAPKSVEMPDKTSILFSGYTIDEIKDFMTDKIQSEYPDAEVEDKGKALVSTRYAVQYKNFGAALLTAINTGSSGQMDVITRYNFVKVGDKIKLVPQQFYRITNLFGQPQMLDGNAKKVTQAWFKDFQSMSKTNEDTAYAGGMGQGGYAGQSYRKFKPKSAGTFKEEQLDEKCWDSHKQVGMKKKGGKMVPNCVPKESAIMKGITGRK